MLLFVLVLLPQLATIASGAVDPLPHPCSRECEVGAPPMTCAFHFKLEWFQTLGKACFNCSAGNLSDCLRPDCVAADGMPRPIVTVNRQLPGPAIRVCLGDRVVVDLENALALETGSLHWHGHHQRGSPHMDGVPHVTQCPVQPGTSFRYVFAADNPGTHFWHSHSGLQRGDGVSGPLVIRHPRDPHRALYDRDEAAHVLLLTDWLHGPANSKFVGHHHGDGNNKPRSMLVNGRGRYGNGTFMNNLTVPAVPISTFSVTPGLKYRFRIINSGFLNCPIELSIDNHTLVVIASDGADLQPVEVDSLVSYAGERFDVVLRASQPASRYWLRARGLMDCDERFHAVHQVAVLAYEGSDDREPAGDLGYAEAARGGKQLNSLNVGTNDHDKNTLSVAELSSLKPGDLSLMKAKPDHTFYLGYDFYKKDNPIFHHPGLYGFNQVAKDSERLQTPQLGHISLQLPASPMIAQGEAALAPLLCNQSSLAGQGRNCSRDFCRCLHRLRVEVGAVLEMVLVDEGAAFDANHPFHLHGHNFHVTAMQRLGGSTTVGEVRRLLENGLAPRRSLHAPLKDTVTVPDGGFTVIRLRASNPGVWLFHCHIGFHVEVGMGLVLQVGDWASFAAAPRGFPTCGDWLPNIDPPADDAPIENQLSLLTPGGPGERLQYQLISNVTPGVPSTPPPQVLVVQHVWPQWWPGKQGAPSSAPRPLLARAGLFTLLLAAKVASW